MSVGPWRVTGAESATRGRAVREMVPCSRCRTGLRGVPAPREQRGHDPDTRTAATAPGPLPDAVVGAPERIPRAPLSRGCASAGRQVAVSTLLTVDVLLLCLIGLVMVGSASSVVSIATYGSPWAIFLREVMWMAIGGAAFYCSVRLDYRRLRRFAPLLLAGHLRPPPRGPGARASACTPWGRAAGSGSANSACSPRSS